MSRFKEKRKFPLSKLGTNPKLSKSMEMIAQNNGLRGDQNLELIDGVCKNDNLFAAIADDFVNKRFRSPRDVTIPQLEDNSRTTSVVIREDSKDKTDSATLVSEASIINSLGARRNSFDTIKENNDLQDDVCSITSKQTGPCCFMRFICCMGRKMNRNKIKSFKDISVQTSLCLISELDGNHNKTEFNCHKTELGTGLTRRYTAETANTGCTWLWGGEKVQPGFDMKLSIENMIKDQLNCLSAKHGFVYEMTNLPPVKNAAHKLMADEASRLKALVGDVFLKKCQSSRLRRIKKARGDKLRTSLTVAMLKKRSNQLRIKKEMISRLHGKINEGNIFKYTQSKPTYAEGDIHAGQFGLIPCTTDENLRYCVIKSRTHASHIPIVTISESRTCKKSTATDEKTHSRKHTCRNKTAEHNKTKKASTVRKESNEDKGNSERLENKEKQSLIMQPKKYMSPTHKGFDQVNKSGLLPGSSSTAKRVTKNVSLSPECKSYTKTSIDANHKPKKIHRHKSDIIDMNLYIGNTLDKEESVQHMLATGRKRDVSRRKNESNQNHVSHKLQNVGTISNELQKFGNDIEYTRELLNDVVRQLEHVNQ